MPEIDQIARPNDDQSEQPQPDAIGEANRPSIACLNRRAAGARHRQLLRSPQSDRMGPQPPPTDRPPRCARGQSAGRCSYCCLWL